MLMRGLYDMVKVSYSWGQKTCCLKWEGVCSGSSLRCDVVLTLLFTSLGTKAGGCEEGRNTLVHVRNVRPAHHARHCDFTASDISVMEHCTWFDVTRFYQSNHYSYS